MDILHYAPCWAWMLSGLAFSTPFMAALALNAAAEIRTIAPMDETLQPCFEQLNA